MMALEEAQRCYVRAGQVRAAVDMYRRAGRWSLLHGVAQRNLTQPQMQV